SSSRTRRRPRCRTAASRRWSRRRRSSGSSSTRSTPPRRSLSSGRADGARRPAPPRREGPSPRRSARRRAPPPLAGARPRAQRDGARRRTALRRRAQRGRDRRDARVPPSRRRAGRDRARRRRVPRPARRARASRDRAVTAAPRPYTLVAELTYRCPLRCAYCANPVDWRAHGATLGAADWAAVLAQAEALGVVQVHLTGGEPCVRRDLEPIVRAARACDLYTNLVTSGVPLDAGRLRRLRAAGLDAVQLSFQDVDARAAARIAGRAVLDRKRAVARWTR